MSWRDIMYRILPPIDGVRPHVTGAYGESRERGPNPHPGVDTNYDVPGQKGINLRHPAVYSPVAGIVTNAGQGTVGRIAIRDANGFSHEILHTHTRHVSVGDPVAAGQLIGTMGNSGVDKPNIEAGANHVHYQVKDPAGRVVDPGAFWDEQGPIDPNPGPPAHLGEYQQYLRERDAGASNGFGNTTDAAIDPSSRAFVRPSDGSSPLDADNVTRRLGRRTVGRSGASFYDTGAAAVPFVPPTDVLRPDLNSFSSRFGGSTSFAVVPPVDAPSGDGPASFGDRFGNWISSPASVAPGNSGPPVPSLPDGTPVIVGSSRRDI